ncbi:hypothetical protein MP638_006005 [Amoeboaphelidium occidentale]|nr:hypothetical protein MP638_006005 [Amoeboaphelidium occidentale]
MEVVLLFHGRSAKVDLQNKPQEVYKALAGLTRVSEYALPYYDIKIESSNGKIVDLKVDAEVLTDLQNDGSYNLRLLPEITDFALPNDVVTTCVLPAKDQLIEPSFNNWEYTEDQYLLILHGMITSNPEYSSLNISDQELKQFLVNIRRLYNENNPFHNFSHGFCVTQMMYSLLFKPESLLNTFTVVERFALIISALGHDLDHPGLSNSFQIALGSDLALIYNDKSPLENLHCSKLFYLLKKSDLLKNMDKDTYLYFRQIVIECIAATDIGKQKDILSAAKNLHSSGSFDLNDHDHKFVLFQLLMKAADVSVELRDVENSEKWVSLLFEEFFRQGDLEQKLDIPKTPNMMRTVNIPKEQVGFISFILLP